MGNTYEETSAVRGFSLNLSEGPGDQTSPGMRDEGPGQRLRVGRGSEGPAQADLARVLLKWAPGGTEKPQAMSSWVVWSERASVGSDGVHSGVCACRLAPSVQRSTQ